MNKAVWLILAMALLPVLALTLYKPTRVFVPTLFGVTCPGKGLCIDDENRLDQATSLAQVALEALQETPGQLSYTPRMIFCSTQKCFENFGFRAASAQTLGTVATVVGPKGWEDHYIRHELIHQWQADKLGSLQVLFAPEWLVEGMAYALSNDPRPILTEPWQTYRTRFETWYKTVDQENLAAEIRKEL